MVNGLTNLDPLEIGGGHVNEITPGRMRLFNPAGAQHYVNAQLDDYRRLPRTNFPWNPPLVMNLRARASPSQPLGTLGFGFWNDPFTISLGQGGAARRFPATPRALWFFYAAPPNALSFTTSVPGHGWKAVSLSTPSIPALLLAPGAAMALLLTKIRLLRRPLMRRALASVTAREKPLKTPLEEWHQYRIAWEEGHAAFSVDGEVVLETEAPPPGPLGFVTWIDNQFATATEELGLRFGISLLEHEQWLEIEDLSIVHR